ncbi:MAG: hypothetical protein SXG53_01195 [Pseudomonadota bacterium]|nr:hypothetical protein [Pseudomonadota bacterium]
MTLNTLFLPLLGGFLFYGLFNGTSHRASVQPAQVLLFWASAIGLPLLLVARGTVYLFEITKQPEPLKTWLIFAAGSPLALCMLLGCVIWFATHTVEGTIAKAHKLISVMGIVVSVLAVAFLFHCTLNPDAPAQVIGLDIRLYTALVVVAVAWGAHAYARFGAIRWGAALLRISSVMVIVAGAAYYILHYEDMVISIWQSLTKPIAEAQASAGLGSAFAAYLLGMIGAPLANFIYTKNVAEARYVLGKGASQLERLFCSADSLKRMVLLTMEDGKVYVGMVKRVAIRGNADPYIVIYPMISGQRTQTQEVAFTTFYQSIYDRFGEDAWEQFQKILPMQRIVSAAYYDQDHHDTFFGSKVLVPYSARNPA